MASKKRSKKEPETFAPGSLEKFVSRKIHRSQIKNAPYNPRRINDDERGRLGAILKVHGMVGPITWNKRTGNIVGGHQRTSMLDTLYATQDYEMTVAEIDVSESEEIEINIALNNPQAQGDWDLTALEKIWRDNPTLNIKSTGFDPADLFKVFGASPFEARGDDPMGEVANKIREARERQQATRDKVKKREETEFYLVVAFKDEDDRDAFCDSVGWERNRYQSGVQLRMIAADWIEDRAEERKRAEAALDAIVDGDRLDGQGVDGESTASQDASDATSSSAAADGDG